MVRSVYVGNLQIVQVEYIVCMYVCMYVSIQLYVCVCSIVTEEELKKELRWVLKKRIVTTREERVRLTEVRGVHTV